MLVRIRPAAPTRAPLMIRRLFPRTKPAIDAASPEYELSSEMTTGMSAPPIGMTVATPMIKARARSEEHTSELQSRGHLVCRLQLGKKKNMTKSAKITEE